MYHFLRHDFFFYSQFILFCYAGPFSRLILFFCTVLFFNTNQRSNIVVSYNDNKIHSVSDSDPLPLQRGQQAPGSVTWCMQGSLGHWGDAHCTSPAWETQISGRKNNNSSAGRGDKQPGGSVRCTRQVQVEHGFEIRVHVCPSLYFCPSRAHTRQETEEGKWRWAGLVQV